MQPQQPRLHPHRYTQVFNYLILIIFLNLNGAGNKNPLSTISRVKYILILNGGQQKPVTHPTF
jgi:hypothetical protein